jgi:hypothetical protein
LSTRRNKKLLKRKMKKRNGTHRITILARLRESFNEEDRAEQFNDREYVDETNRLFDLLMEEYPHEPVDPKDRAIYDIVADIFRACGKEVE